MTFKSRGDIGHNLEYAEVDGISRKVIIVSLGLSKP